MAIRDSHQKKQRRGYCGLDVAAGMEGLSTASAGVQPEFTEFGVRQPQEHKRVLVDMRQTNDQLGDSTVPILDAEHECSVKDGFVDLHPVPQSSGYYPVHGGYPSYTRLYPIRAAETGSSRWQPQHIPGGIDHRPGADWVLVARGGQFKFHQFQQCGALQWGHCRVNAHDAVSRGCVQCVRCWEQLQSRSWPEVPQSPSNLNWDHYAPHDFIPETGGVSWVDSTLPTQLLRWLCLSRQIDSGGQDSDLVSRLLLWQLDVDDTAHSDSNEEDSPPTYDEAMRDVQAEEDSLRHWCSMHSIKGEGSHWDPVLGMVVFIGLVGVVAGFDAYAETTAVRESMRSDE